MNYMVLTWNEINKASALLKIPQIEMENICFFLMQKLRMGADIYYKQGKNHIFLCSSEIILKAEPVEEKNGDLFIKSVELSNETQFFADMPYFKVLPGEWTILSKSEWHRKKQYVTNNNHENYDDVLFARADLYAYMSEWRMLDQYNDKLLMEAEEKKKASECEIAYIRQEEIGIIRLELSKQLEQIWILYEEGAQVEIYASDDTSISYKGKVLKRMEKKQLRIELLEEGEAIAFSKKHYKITLSNGGLISMFHRQKWAMERLFLHKSVNPCMGDILLKEQEKVTFLEDIKEHKLQKYLERFGENEKQKEAFFNALRTEDIYLIQGPPGTGKTKVITELVNYLTEHQQSVLLSSCSHIAVDNVLERMEKEKNIFPVRLGKQEDISKETQKYMPQFCKLFLQEEIAYRLQKHHNYEISEEDFEKRMRESYQKELEHIEQKIRNNKQKYQLEDYSEEELELIDEYLRLISNEKKWKNEYAEKKFSFEKVSKQYAKLEAEYQTIRAKLFLYAEQEKNYSIISPKIYESRNLEKTMLLQQAEAVKRKMEALSLPIYESQYKIINEKYTRIVNDFIYTKNMLEQKKKNSKESVNAYVQRIQGGVRDTRNLIKEYKKKKRNMNKRIKKEQMDFVRKKELLERTKHIRTEWQAYLPYLDNELENIYIELSNVVAATCSGIASYENQQFKERAYDYVIIDEAAHCNTLDVLIPLSMGKKAILVGDQKQLYPSLQELNQERQQMSKAEKEAAREEYKKLQEICKDTLFAQLYEKRLHEQSKTMLEIQYRMTEEIGTYISDTFYEGKLKNGVGQCFCGISNIRSAVSWMDSGDAKEEQGKNRSYKNQKEMDMMLGFLEMMDKQLTEEKSIGIICYYRLQADEIRKSISNINYNYLKVECGTIDGFQGKEKDWILINLVRTEGYTRFIEDENRLNVAVSRARELALVVGSVSYVKNKKYLLLQELYYYAKERGGIINGNIYRT